MKILGLIMENNPFHKGHQYYIQEAINLVKPDYTIVITSGNYTMRGEFSIINKIDKTNVLLQNGIDFIFAFFPRSFYKSILVQPQSHIIVHKNHNYIVFLFDFLDIAVFEFAYRCMVCKHDFIFQKFCGAHPFGNTICS